MELIQLRRELDQKARIVGRTLATSWETELRRTSAGGYRADALPYQSQGRDRIGSAGGSTRFKSSPSSTLTTRKWFLLGRGLMSSVKRKDALSPVPVAWEDGLLQTGQPSRYTTEPVVHRFCSESAARVQEIWISGLQMNPMVLPCTRVRWRLRMRQRSRREALKDVGKPVRAKRNGCALDRSDEPRRLLPTSGTYTGCRSDPSIWVQQLSRSGISVQDPETPTRSCSTRPADPRLPVLLLLHGEGARPARRYT